MVLYDLKRDLSVEVEVISITDPPHLNFRILNLRKERIVSGCTSQYICQFGSFDLKIMEGCGGAQVE